MMKARWNRIESLGILCVLLLVGCSNRAAAAPQQNGNSNQSEVLPDQPDSSGSIEILSTPEIFSYPSKPTLSPTGISLPVFEATQEPTRPIQFPTRLEIQIDTPAPEFNLCSPIAGIDLEFLPKIISDPYRPPPPGSDDRHEGVDFSYFSLGGKKAFIAGVGVQSVMAGRVTAAILNSFPYGNFVIVETPREGLPVALAHRLKIPKGNSLYLLYAHMQSLRQMSLGSPVEACQLIGKVGHSGNAKVDHLHLEARIGPPGAVFIGMGAFKPWITTEERANYKLWRTSGVYQHFDPMLVLAQE